jgi:hypothetical protein
MVQVAWQYASKLNTRKAERQHYAVLQGLECASSDNEDLRNVHYHLRQFEVSSVIRQKHDMFAACPNKAVRL